MLSDSFYTDSSAGSGFRDNYDDFYTLRYSINESYE